MGRAGIFPVSRSERLDAALGPGGRLSSKEDYPAACPGFLGSEYV
jgi:hypothetical protein